MRTPVTIQKPIERVHVQPYRVPTDFPEADGTLNWESTTIVVVEVSADHKTGLGYTYAPTAAALLIREQFKDLLIGSDALAVSANWQNLLRAVRNMGSRGVSASAIAAVDIALWDLKAKILGVSLVDLLGRMRESVPVYGSGGFTSYSIDQLQNQLRGWIEAGIPMVKMKVGQHPNQDLQRVNEARRAIGFDHDLLVDANGAYDRKQALAFAENFRRFNVCWFEEPVSSDDLEGLRLLRDRAPAGMEITAGEYGYDHFYFRRMLEAGAVDVLQADATRCAGFTGFLKSAVLCEAHNLQLSAHTAPTLHAHVCCGITPLRHVEYFHDHVRIEQMFFDGLPELKDGRLYPDFSKPGMGLEIKRQDVRDYAL